MQRTLTEHHAFAEQARIRRRLRSTSDAPTRNGASPAASPPHAGERAEGARVSSSFTAPPSAYPFQQFEHGILAFFSACFGMAIWGLVMGAALWWSL